MPDNEICYLTAREIWHKIGKHQISATEVMQAHLSQIERVNPTVNAIITLQLAPPPTPITLEFPDTCRSCS